MRRRLSIVAAALMAISASSSRAAQVSWRDLPPLPHALGGQFAGVIDDALVVAGGSYFDKPTWDGGIKRWVDTIYVLRRGAQSWELAGHLPSPLGYGAALSVPGALVLAGGQTPSGASKKVYRLQLKDGTIAIDHLPDLPEPACSLAGAVHGRTLYVAAGQADPAVPRALRSFWSLRLDAEPRRWHKLPPIPAPARIQPVMTANGGEVFLASGAELTGSPGPPPGRRFLTDAWLFTAPHGWKQIADLPHPVGGGFAVSENGRIVVLSGNDGRLADREYEVKDRHPGFCKQVYVYDAGQNHWRQIGEMPVALVTSGIVRWGDEWVIPGGEDRPSHRSARVIAMKLILP